MPLTPRPYDPSSLAVITLDRYGKVTTWSAEAEVLLGWPEHEALGAPLPGGPETGPDDLLEGLLRVEPAWAVETTRRRRDGSSVRVAVTAVGLEAGVITVWQDLTEREALFRTIEEAGAAISHAGLDGTWLRANPRMCEMLGYGRDELIGRTFYELTHPDDIPGDVEAVSRLLAGEVPATRREKRYRRRDGSYMWVTITATLVRDAAGRPLHFVTVFEDVTERKRLFVENESRRRAAEMLAEASTLLASSLDQQTILDTLVSLCLGPVADWCLIDVVEEAGRVRRAATGHVDSTKAALVRGLSRFPPGASSASPVVEVLRSGRSLLLAEPPTDFAAVVAADAEHEGILSALEIHSLMVAPLVARGEVIGAMSFVRSSGARYDGADLTLAEELGRRAALAIDNARLYRQAEQASRIKDEFLATLSHELRTPLTAILGWVRMLRSGTLDTEKARRALGVIERNTELQAQLIEDLLDVSRIVSGKLHLNLGPVHPAQVVQAAVDVVRDSAEKKQVRVVVDVSADAAPVWGDVDRLQQVVVNLLSNAVKFTPAGGRVGVRVERRDGHTTIEVTDTGKGIRPEMLAGIFEPFSQGDSSRTRHFGGLGLGLAIVRHLVEMHHGTVSAFSAGEGAGAVFTVRLPPMPVRPPGVPPVGRERPSAPPAVEFPALTGVRVLVVDDHADGAELVKVVLEQHGAKVTTAGTTSEALASMAAEAPHVLVSDISMPGEDGHALIQKVRALDAIRGKITPAIALTAYARAEDRDKALAAGFHRHIAKPVEPERLVRAVATVVNPSQLCEPERAED